MPRRTRNMILGEAKVVRTEGESVVLYIDSSTPDTSDATPYSAHDLQRRPALSTYTKQTIYARVTYLPSETVTFDEGGREMNRKIQVEAPIEMQALMHSASGFQIQDGTIFRKSEEKISESRNSFIVIAVGELKVKM